MRRLLPRSLPGWVLLILISGLLASQAATLLIASRERLASEKIVEFFRLDDRATSFVKLMSGASPAERKEMAASLSNSAYALDVSDTPQIAHPIPADEALAEFEDLLVGRLASYGVTDARVKREGADGSDISTGGPPQADPDAGAVERGLQSLSSDFSRTDRLIASIQFKDGQWLNIALPMTPASPVLTPSTLPWYGATAAIVVGLSLWALRRLTAPYRTIENAVKLVGDDLRGPALPETGSSEYRSAARAINAMRARLREYVEDREHLAAALAHDLRTPITRMRLRLEMLHDPEPKRMLSHDLEDIELIARSVIDYAKLEFNEEPSEMVDVWSMLDSIVDRYDQISYEGPDHFSPKLVCHAKPTALRRCLVNLIENAAIYGERARVTLSRSETHMTMTILDEGPGIPEDKLATVFRPFVRVETSRNRETGGSGLGLTIAQNFARHAGGEVTLRNRAEGGLCTTLTLPLAKMAGQPGGSVAA
ncbi:ATP-binding protein [Jiella sp. M17.18]|uniref:ATP-binding protein n=1 Tax=Jiella sp. M17.18 TaxID=3234247 RepID=UPI0034DEEBDB